MDYNATTSEEWNIAMAEMKEEGTFWGIKDQDIVDQGIKIMDDIDELLDQIDNIDNATKEYLDDLDESGTYISDEEIKEISDENWEKRKEIEAKIKALQKKHKDLWDNAKSDQARQGTTPVKAAEDSKSEVMSRSNFQGQYRQAQEGKLPKGQIDAQLKLYDAMMDTYAKEMGITIDEAYAEVIDSVTADEPLDGTARRSGVRYQTIQGYIQKMPNGKYRIGIMQPNVTTGLHEQAHLGKSLMEIMANKSPAWASRLKAAEEWCGVKDGKWTTEAEDK